MKPVSFRTLEALLDRGYRLSDFLPYVAYDQERQVFILADGSAGGIIEFDPLPGLGVDQSTAMQLTQSFESLFTSPLISPGSAIQVILYSSPFVEDALEEWKRLREGKKVHPLVREFFEELYRYATEGDAFFKGSNYRKRLFRGFITLRVPPKEDKAAGKFLKLIKRFRGNGTDVNIPDLDEVRRNLETIMSALEPLSVGQSKMNPRILDVYEFIRLMIEILHGYRYPVSYDPSIPIRDQLFYESLTVLPSGRLAITQKHKHIQDNGVSDDSELRFVVVTSSNGLPPEVYIRLTGLLAGDYFQQERQIPGPFMITFNMEVLDQFSARAKLSSKQKMATLQASGPLGMFAPRVPLLRDNLYYAMQKVSVGCYIHKAWLSLIAFPRGKDEHIAKSTAQRILGIYTAGGFTGTEEIHIALPVFLSSLPLCYNPKWERFLFRSRTLLSENSAHMVPILGDWKGTQTPVVLLWSRRGNPILVDLFDSPGNYNFVVAAASGSGKSFFVNYLVMSYLSIGGIAFIIDVGKSYKKLCEIVDGDFLEFRDDNPVSLNPFTSVRSVKSGDEYTIHPEDLAFIQPLIGKMAAGQEGSLTQVEMGILEDVIITAFRKKLQDTTITDLWEVLNERARKPENPEWKLAKMLFSYTKHGKFGRYFNSPANITFQKDLNVLELQELRGKRDLQSVVLLFTIYYITKAIEMGDRARRKLVIIDEAWDLLSDPMSAKFIENAFRIYRKYGAGAGAVTQGINDLYNSPSGRAIAENSDHFFLLRQKPESLRSLFEEGKLLLNEALAEALVSVHTQPGRYSEVFLYFPTGKDVGRFIPNPFALWTFTTHPDELSKVQELIDQGLSYSEAIRKLAKEYPGGYRKK